MLMENVSLEEFIVIRSSINVSNNLLSPSQKPAFGHYLQSKQRVSNSEAYSFKIKKMCLVTLHTLLGTSIKQRTAGV